MRPAKSLRPRRARTYTAALASAVLLLSGAGAGTAAATTASQAVSAYPGSFHRGSAHRPGLPVGSPAGAVAGAAGAAKVGRHGPGPRLTADTNAPCNHKAAKKNYAQCFAVVRTPANHQITPMAAGPPAGALGPADIQSAYRLPATGGAGQTVAIVNAYGDSTAESDLAAFRAYYGLPACTTANGCFKKVDQNGGTNYPPDNSGWALETSLDLDAVSSACPNCHILLVEGNTASFSDLGTAVDTAVTLGAKFVSNSYGVNGETSSETSYDHYYNHPGVAVVAASGDSGYGNQDWPASNPDVTAAGGTTLVKDASSPRGWDETAWAGSGSGCSPYEPRPAYQQNINTNCPNNKAEADMSADADPASGLGIYDTLGYSGWLQVGGTSMATPLISSMYALAGTPTPGTYPVTYPFGPGRSAGLFDITQGSNGSCGNVLCNAGPGWDGPTGLGTPDGVTALSNGPAGDIAGQVTDKATGKPLPGATVSTPQGYTAVTDANGKYDLFLPGGSYDVTVHDFGYADQTQTGVQVTSNQTTTASFALAAEPASTLSGTITDGSGHKWPLYAEITIDGDPNGPFYTNPYTGQYSISLPQQATYTAHVTPVSGGYQAKTVTVQMGIGGQQQNITVNADPAACTAPGYAWAYHGAATAFTGRGHTGPQGGWTVTDSLGHGNVWRFNSYSELPLPPTPTAGSPTSKATSTDGAATRPWTPPWCRRSPT